MKVSVVISVFIHILAFGFIYSANTKKIYNNDIALYFDDNYSITSSDISVSRSSKEDTTVKKNIDYKKTVDNTGSDNRFTKDDTENNSADIATGQYYDAVVNGVINGIKLPLPQYPALAKKRGLRGTTVVDIFIKEDGSVSDVKIVSSSGERILDNSVKETVLKRWKLPKAYKNLVVRKIFEFDLID